jgi:hypothetical protein
MKKQPPARNNVIVLKQILNLIPRNLIGHHARDTKVDLKARTFTVTSHLATMLFAQLSHAIGLNDVCDWLHLKKAALSRFGVTPPSRNALSHANKQRDALFIERLFWSVLEHLQEACPGFATGKKGKGLLRRFKVRIHAVDSTVISLVANCMDWAKHRNRKAAAKMHLRLDLHSFLPSFAVVDTAAHHDNKRAREVCASINAGEIVVFDKAYVDFEHLNDLDERGVFWVTRAKDNMKYRAVKNLAKNKAGIIKDQIICLQIKGGAKMRVRRVEAWVEVEGQQRKMVFISNNFAWSPNSVCDLYRRRWDIEVFFKQVKQSLKLTGFLGHSANAVRWQVYAALLIYVLLRFMAHQANWWHSFTRLFAVSRSALWERVDLLSLLKSYGTASGGFRMSGNLDQAWFPGMKPCKL